MFYTTPDRTSRPFCFGRESNGLYPSDCYGGAHFETVESGMCRKASTLCLDFQIYMSAQCLGATLTSLLTDAGDGDVSVVIQAGYNGTKTILRYHNLQARERWKQQLDFYSSRTNFNLPHLRQVSCDKKPKLEGSRIYGAVIESCAGSSSNSYVAQGKNRLHNKSGSHKRDYGEVYNICFSNSRSMNCSEMTIWKQLHSPKRTYICGALADSIIHALCIESSGIVNITVNYKS